MVHAQVSNTRQCFNNWEGQNFSQYEINERVLLKGGLVNHLKHSKCEINKLGSLNKFGTVVKFPKK